MIVIINSLKTRCYNNKIRKLPANKRNIKALSAVELRLRRQISYRLVTQTSLPYKYCEFKVNKHLISRKFAV